MPEPHVPQEHDIVLLKQMVTTLDDERPSVALFEPMVGDEEGLWFSTQIFAIPEGAHPIQVIRELCEPENADLRAGAKALGLVTYGDMVKLPKDMTPEAFMDLDTEARRRLPRVRVRTQLIVAGPFAYAKTATLNNEGVIDVPSVIEEPVTGSPLIEACQYLLALAAGIVSDPPTGGEG